MSKEKDESSQASPPSQKKQRSTAKKTPTKSPPPADIDSVVSILPLDSIARLSSLLHEMSGTSASKLEILAILSRGKRSVGELTSVLNLSNSAVSQHLNRLKAYNIVDSERSLHNQVYELRPDFTSEVLGLIKDVFGLKAA